MVNEYDENLKEDYSDECDALSQAIASENPKRIRDQALKEIMASGGEMVIAETMINQKFAKDNPHYKTAMNIVQGMSAFRAARATKALLDSYEMDNSPVKE